MAAKEGPVHPQCCSTRVVPTLNVAVHAAFHLEHMHSVKPSNGNVHPAGSWSSQLQELKRVEGAWQLRWMGEAARLQRQHGDDLAAAAAKHHQVGFPVCSGHGSPHMRLAGILQTALGSTSHIHW